MGNDKKNTRALEETLFKDPQLLNADFPEILIKLIHHLPQGIFIKDKDSNYLAINRHYAKDLNIDPEKVKGKNDFDFYPKELASKYRADDQIVLKSGKKKEIEESYIINGNEYWINTIKIPYKNSKGKIAGLIGIFEDKTESHVKHFELAKEKENKRRIRKKIKQLLQFMYSIKVGIVTHAADTSIIDCNTTAQKILGLTNEEVIGRKAKDPIWKFVHEDGSAMPVEEYPISKVLKSKTELQEYVVGILHQDRSDVTWVIVSGLPEFDLDGKIVQVYITFMDITELKQAKHKLEESGQRFKDLSFSIAEWIWEVDANSKYTYSYGAEELLGYTDSEILGKTAFDLMPEDEARRVKKEYQKLFKGKEIIRNLINWNICKDGTKKCLLTNGMPVFDSTGTLIGYRGIDKNITDNVLAETALKESEEKMRLLFENMNEAFALHEVITDKRNKPIDYRYIDINPAFEKFTNLKREEVIGHTVLEIMPNTEQYWIDKYGEVALKGKPLDYTNYSQELDRYYEVRAYCPKHGFFAVTFRDVTPRKKAEKALKEGEMRFRSIIENAGDVVLLSDLQGRIIMANQMAHEKFGYSKEELLKKTVMEVDKNYPSLKQCLELWNKLNYGESTKFESIHVRKDGKEFPVEITTSAIELNGEKHLIGFVRDITEQKRQEEELSRHDQLNQSLLHLYEADFTNEIEFIQLVLDQAVLLTHSEIGYFHFFDEDQQEIELVTWSTETFKKCTAVYDNHYPLTSAGVWADAVRNMKPVIINDYPKLKNKKGMPKGHFPLKNHLGIPIIDEKKVVGIIGVGNKAIDYNKDDIKQLEVFTKSIWEIIKGKRVSQLIKNNEEKFRLLFENMNEGFIHGEIIMNESENAIDWIYININAAYEKMIGLKSTAVIGKKASELKIFEKKYFSKWLQRYGKVALSAKDDFIEFYSEHYESWYNVHIFSPKTGQFAATFSDVTENIQYRQELERSNRELEQFAYVASHDLQEPLRKIKNYAELLENKYKQELAEQAQKYIDIITRGAGRMQNLINDLLSFSRISRAKLHFETADLNKILDEVIDSLELKIRHNKAKITSEKLPEIKVEPSLLYQIFQNLLSNALKFRSKLTPVIKIKYSELKNEYKFSVSDNGIGIDMEYADKIFEVFQRMHSRENYEGTGIGLALCKKAVEIHHGEIWVQSVPGKRTVFYFTISKKLN